MTTNITDWVVQLGWDASKVETGQKRLERTFTRLNKNLAKADAIRTAELKKQTAEMQKQKSLAARTNSLGSGKSGPPGSLARRLGRQAEALDVKRFRKETSLLSLQSRGERLLNSIPEDSNNPVLAKLRGSAETTTARINELKQSIRTATKAGDFARIDRSLIRLRSELALTAQAFHRVNRRMSASEMLANRLKGSLINLAVAYGSVFALIGGATAFYRVGRDMESLQATLLAASGSAEQAAIDFKFITDTSLALGVELKEAASGYAKIGAAARAANFSTEQTKNIFLAATESARAFGLSAERTQLVYLAFDQILSKGVVSMEELRRQLGENIFGAFQHAAKAMGVTTTELNQLVSSGQLASEDFLPKFANELRKVVRETGALNKALHKVQANEERFKSILQLATAEGFTANSSLFSSAFQDLVIVVKESIPLFKLFGISLAGYFKTATESIKVLSAVLNPVVGVINELLELMTKISNKDISSNSLTTFQKVLRIIAITAIETKIAILELELAISNLFTNISNLPVVLRGLINLLPGVGANTLGQELAQVTARMVVKQQTEHNGAASLASNPLPGLGNINRENQIRAEQSKIQTIQDNSKTEFHLHGTPEENKKMIEEWYSEKLTFAQGFNF